MIQDKIDKTVNY